MKKLILMSQVNRNVASLNILTHDVINLYHQNSIQNEPYIYYDATQWHIILDQSFSVTLEMMSLVAKFDVRFSAMLFCSKTIGSINTSKNRRIYLYKLILSRHCGLEQEKARSFQCQKTQLVSFGRSNNTGDFWCDNEEKPSFKILGYFFFSKLNWGSYIISIAKTAFKRIGALIRFMKFLSPEVTLYLFESTIRLYMEQCCHAWTGAASCYLECQCWSFHRQYYFGRCSSKWARLVAFRYSRGKSNRYFDRLHDFSVTIPTCYKDVYVNSFFPRTTYFWNSPPYRMLSFDLSSKWLQVQN